MMAAWDTFVGLIMGFLLTRYTWNYPFVAALVFIISMYILARVAWERVVEEDRNA